MRAVAIAVAVLLISVASSTNLGPKASSAALHPVVLVPALIGSQIELRLDRTHVDHVWCDHKSDWYSAWINTDEWMPFVWDCWASNFGLVYDPKTGLVSNPEGVESRIIDYGGLDGLRFLDQTQKVMMYNNIIGNLTGRGYVQGQNLRGAPYDWRFGPNQWGQDFADLKALIEDTYARNGNQSVILISLSMGGPYTSLFLSSFVTQQWKDEYIRLWISLSGVFSGSSMAIRALNFYENFTGIETLASEKFRDLARRNPSVSWLLPQQVSFAQTEVWVQTPKRNYTTVDMKQLLLDSGASETAAFYAEVLPIDGSKAPGVEVYCSYGYNVSTESSYIFKNEDFASQPSTVVYADGDGVVLTPSLAQCSQWQGQQSQPVHTLRYPNLYHAMEINQGENIRDIVEICVNA